MSYYANISKVYDLPNKDVGLVLKAFGKVLIFMTIFLQTNIACIQPNKTEYTYFPDWLSNLGCHLASAK